MHFYYTPLVNSGMKSFAHLLLKYVETNVNDFILDHTDNELTVAAIQLNSSFADTIMKVRNNVDKIAGLVARAAQGGAKFIVTPELAVHGYVDVDLSKQYNNDNQTLGFWAGAQRMWCHESVHSPCPDSIEIGINSTVDFINGPRVLTSQGSRTVQLIDASTVALSHDSEEFTAIKDIARTHGVYAQVGYMERADENGEERIYNSVNVYGPSGDLIYHHRKATLYNTVDRFVFTESQLSSTPYFDTPYGRISSAICYEGNSIFQPLYEHQVDTMLYSVAWVVSPSFYAPGYHTAGENVKNYPMNVVMANWAFPDNPPVQLNVCSENTYKVWDGDAQCMGSGLSYVMDSDGDLRGLLTGNPQEDVLFATLPCE